MSENSNDQTNELSDYDKTIAAEEARRAELYAKAHAEQNAKAEVDRNWKNIGTMSPEQYRRWVIEQVGFFPGV